MSEIIIIAAMAENRIIGRDSRLPWSIGEDMKHFRELTRGWPCIMGRKTWESLPKKPLPGRPNIVVSKSLTQGSEAAVFPSLEEALEHCRDSAKVYICGGEMIYREAMEYADSIELTLIRAEYEGDAFFPEFDSSLWEEQEREDHENFSFIRYRRRNTASTEKPLKKT
ncbi:MAG: dihydrofolate reductase [Treponema sp.]|jgi:dihydrofolate reductase|nr:dihydrofolate reductase [Treponema sp.]